MTNMLVTAQSTCHLRISQLFRVPAETGRYPRFCPNPCDGVQMHCGCGWPVCRTEWDAPEGFCVHAEWVDKWDNVGRNNIIIVVERDHNCYEGSKCVS